MTEITERMLLNLPFVLVNRTVRNANTNAVIVDEDFGVRAVLEHLIELGHSRIAHVAGPKQSSTGRDRLRAFRDNMKVHDLNPDLVSDTKKYTIEEGFSACEALLQLDSTFTAILARNDLIALGCIDALEKAGKRVPEDISIVGGNDIPFLSRMVPALTTINIPKYEMGPQAAQSLLELIDGSVRNPVVVRIQPKLVVRGSTGPVGR